MADKNFKRKKDSFVINSSTQMWLLSSVFALTLSIAITRLFDAYPSVRFISNLFFLYHESTVGET